MYFNLYNFFFSNFNHLFVIILIEINSGVTGVIHGKYTENIKQYQLAVPHKATTESEFSTFHLNHFHDFEPKEFMKRRKREIDDPDAVHYGVAIDNEVHHVELWPDRDFLHPQALIERRDPTLPVHKRDVRSFKNKKMCYYIGKVRGHNNSRAALSTCDGLTGYIHIGKNMYYIEPVHSHSPNSEGHHLHVVYPAERKPTEQFCAVKNSEEDWNNAIKYRLREEYQKDKDLFKRQATFHVVPQWMEVLTVCDKKMVLKHKGKRDIDQWILTLFSIVKSYYNDGSMTGVLQPVLVRVLLLEKEEEEMDLNIVEDSHDALESFCPWASKLQPKDPTHPNHFDIAVLLSDWDFCNHGNCNVEGSANIGAACSNDKNCQVCEDKGLMTGMIIAHEQGHLLGMNHDAQPPVPCPARDPADNSIYVMAPIGGPHIWRWSPCSTAQMRQMAEAHLLDCFNDEPVNDEYPIADVLPGAVYGLDEQCNMYHRDVNDSLGGCRQPRGKPVNCSLTRCIFGKECRNYLKDLADGTPCGENKWCFAGSCEDKGTRPKAIDGGWGEWGDWTKCTKSCGRGVQFKERLCDNPKPDNHGTYCIGESKNFRICNPQDCPVDAPSFREMQCQEMFPKSEIVKAGTLKPEDLDKAFFNVKDPCRLMCVTKDKVRRTIASAIADGAKCEIGNPLKLCLSGRCAEVGCDGKFEDSEAKLDRCGVCNGDGTLCKLVEGQDKTAYKGYRMIVVVPAGAKKVKIEKNDPSTNILALGLPDKETVTFNADFKLLSVGVHPLGPKRRSYFLYTRTQIPPGIVESIIWDTTKEDIGVYIGHRGRSLQVLVKWSWIEATDTPTREPKFRWQIAEYKECSAKCNGGIQDPVISCYEEISGRVADSFCEKLDKPKDEPAKCNEKPCEPEWKVGTWSKCRACKTKGGVRTREVQCVKTNPRPGGDDILQEDSECTEPRPGAIELCATREKCKPSKRKAPHIPAKFQDSVWRQMNKLHLKKRGVMKEHVYLKGQAPTTTKSTTTFTWDPPPLTKREGKKDVLIDKGPPEPIVTVDKMIAISVNDSEGESNMGGPQDKTIIVPGTEVTIKGMIFPTRYPKTEGKNKKSTTCTSKPKPKTTKK